MILLTGATGLLGSHLIDRALTHGASLRVVARKVSRRTRLSTATADVEVVAHDLLEPTPTSLFDGVDTVIHAAALSSPFAADAAKMVALNVTATERLAREAAAAGVRTWVQVSSIATLSGAGRVPVTEEGGAPRDTLYARTKSDADRALAVASGAMHVLTVYPTFMLGAWDARPSSGAILLALRLGRLAHFVDCVKNVSAASSVAHGIFQALDAHASGPYVLGGADVAMESFVRLACEAVGRDPATVKRLDAMPDAPDHEISEGELSILREFCIPSPASSAKAERDFGYDARVDVGALVASVRDYFVEQRLLGRPKEPQ